MQELKFISIFGKKKPAEAGLSNTHLESEISI